MRWVLLLLASCGGALTHDAPDGTEPPLETIAPIGPMQAAPRPNPCGAPDFAPGQCTDETLNDGRGPDDHRKVCVVGGAQWILYPSGEQWLLLPVDGGNPVACHGFPDGGSAH